MEELWTQKAEINPENLSQHRELLISVPEIERPHHFLDKERLNLVEETSGHN